jgi:hypothetical protein
VTSQQASQQISPPQTGQPPPRRKPPLDAHLIPVQRALLTRAKALEDSLATITPLEAYPDVVRMRRELAHELRALASELHGSG